MADICEVPMESRKRETDSKSDSVAAKKIKWNWPCEYCERGFRTKNELRGHTSSVHSCSVCWKIVLKDDREEHAEMHKREKEENEEIERKKKLFYDDFVEKFITTKKLNEYESIKDLDVGYILKNYLNQVGEEELLIFVRNGLEIMNDLDYLCAEEIIFLLENDAITEEDAANFLDYDPYEGEALIEYFLEKNVNIRPRWVAVHINDGDLIRKIKEKQNFTFEEIFSESPYFCNNDMEEMFYQAVHEHFPDPDFEEEFPLPKDFARIPTNYVNDYLKNRYFYDEEDDELWIVVGHRESKIAIGKCREMIGKGNLDKLTAKYYDAIDAYVKSNKEVSELFDEIDDTRDRDEKADLYDCLYKESIPDRNYWANIVSHTYFVIANKTIVPTLEYLAKKKIVKEKINFDQLPSPMQRKIVKFTGVPSAEQ